MSLRSSRRKKQGRNLVLLLCIIAVSPFLPRKESATEPVASLPTPRAARATPRQAPAPVKPHLAKETAVVARVVDGDTLEIHYRGRKDTVRFIGVDTPEKRDNEKARRDAARTKRDIETIIATGKAASSYLRSLVRVGDTVTLEFDVRPRDKYDRILAYVYRRDGVMLNELLVRGGYAQAYTLPPDVRYAERFRNAEAEARREGRGLWR